MGYGKANYSDKGLPRRLLHQHPRTATPTNLLTRDPTRRSRSPSSSRPRRYDFEASNVQTFAAAHVVSYGGNLRFNRFDLSIAPAADNRDRVRRLRPGRDLPLEHVPLGRRRRASIASTTSTTSCSRRATTLHDQAAGGPDVPRLVQPRLPLAVGDQQLPRPDDRRAAQPRRCSARRSPAGSIRCRSASVGNPDLKEQSLDAFEIGYTGVVERPRRSSRRRSTSTRLKNDIFFTQDRSARYTAANPPPGWPLPPAVIGLRARAAASRRASPTRTSARARRRGSSSA